MRQGGGLSGFAMRTRVPVRFFGAGHASHVGVGGAWEWRYARDLRGGRRNDRRRDRRRCADRRTRVRSAQQRRRSSKRISSSSSTTTKCRSRPTSARSRRIFGRCAAKPFAILRARKAPKRCSTHLPFGGAALKAIETAEMGAMRFIAPAEKTAVIFEELGFRYIGPDRRPQLTMPSSSAQGRAKNRRARVAARSDASKEGLRARRDGFANVSRRRRAHSSSKTEKSNLSRAPARRSPMLSARRLPRGRPRSARHRDHRRDAGRHQTFEVCESGIPTDPSTSELRKPMRSVSPQAAATSGLSPVCAIYSTFLQRAYDQIVHDVVVQNLPVVFCHGSRGYGRRRRPDPHGTLRHRVLAHVTEYGDHGAAQRG